MWRCISVTNKVVKEVLVAGFVGLTLLSSGHTSFNSGAAQASSLKSRIVVNTHDETQERLGQENFQDKDEALSDKTVRTVVGDNSFPSRDGSDSVTVVHVNEARSNLVVFNFSGQALKMGSLCASDGSIVGAAKSVLSVDNSLITLHTGKVVLVSNSTPLSLTVKACTIVLKPHSRVFVDGTNNEAIYIVSLPGNKPKALSVQRVIPDDTVCVLDASEEAVFGKGGLTKQVTSGERMRQAFGLTSLAKKASNFSPIRLHACEDSEFYVTEQGHLMVLVGWLLLRAPTETIVHSDLGVVHLSKDTWLNLECIPGLLRVGVCNVEGKSTVTAGRHHIPIKCGQEVLVCDHTPTEGDLSASDGIMRRRLSSHLIGNGLTAVLSDFSILSLLSNAGHLYGLRNPCTSSDRNVYERLLRTIAIVHLVTNGKGSYFAQPDLPSKHLAANQDTKLSKMP